MLKPYDVNVTITYTESFNFELDCEDPEQARAKAEELMEDMTVPHGSEYDYDVVPMGE